MRWECPFKFMRLFIADLVRKECEEGCKIRDVFIKLPENNILLEVGLFSRISDNKNKQASAF